MYLSGLGGLLDVKRADVDRIGRRGSESSNLMDVERASG